jgi:hypothetical protein
MWNAHPYSPSTPLWAVDSSARPRFLTRPQLLTRI